MPSLSHADAPLVRHPAARGLSLVELLIFIVVVSLALVGLLSVFLQSAQHSADPQQRRQALAIAESLLEEVTLMPFTFCDGDDPNVATAASVADCAWGAPPSGPRAGQTRFATPQFNGVRGYNGYTETGIVDITNTPVPGLSGYAASVVVATAPLNDITAASANAVLITVTVTGPAGSPITLQGYRTLYAPNTSL